MRHLWLLAEFEDTKSIVSAARELRSSDVRVRDAHVPYQVRELEEVLELPPSPLPAVMLLGGLLGAGGAYGLQWLINVVLYPLDVGGRPYHFPLAFVPITFEMGVLTAAFFGLAGVIAAGRLFRLWRPVFEVDAFRSATKDHFWLEIEIRPGEEPEQALRIVEQCGAVSVARMEGPRHE